MMTPQERAACELQADRCRRRGEVGQAISLYQRIATSFPNDPAIAAKVEQLGQMLQPLELHHPKANPQPGSGEPTAFSTLEEEAEYLAERGEYVNAAAIYRKALRERPDSELLQERLGQLFELARQSGALPRAVPRPAPQRTFPAVPGPRAPAADSRPREDDKEQRLRGLLSRLSERRRSA